MGKKIEIFNSKVTKGKPDIEVYCDRMIFHNSHEEMAKYGKINLSINTGNTEYDDLLFDISKSRVDFLNYFEDFEMKSIEFIDEELFVEGDLSRKNIRFKVGQGKSGFDVKLDNVEVGTLFKPDRKSGV
mgnify:CR=1 FL=1